MLLVLAVSLSTFNGLRARVPAPPPTLVATVAPAYQPDSSTTNAAHLRRLNLVENQFDPPHSERGLPLLEARYRVELADGLRSEALSYRREALDTRPAAPQPAALIAPPFRTRPFPLPFALAE